MNNDQWCDYHRGPSGTARPVRDEPRMSGPPMTSYACAPCREQRNLRALDTETTDLPERHRP